MSRFYEELHGIWREIHGKVHSFIAPIERMCAIFHCFHNERGFCRVSHKFNELEKRMMCKKECEHYMPKKRE